jgi:hypothetical protein
MIRLLLFSLGRCASSLCREVRLFYLIRNDFDELSLRFLFDRLFVERMRFRRCFIERIPIFLRDKG